MPLLGTVIGNAIREGGYTAENPPNVVQHLSGTVTSKSGLAKGAVQLSQPLMAEIEAFLKKAGVPADGGLSILKADAASETLVLTANALKGTGREVAIKVTHALGVFEQKDHIPGKAVDLHEPMMADGVQKLFSSAYDGSALLVRIEPIMLPVDKVLASLRVVDEAQALRTFSNNMKEKINARGLADIDLKPDNYAIRADEPPVTSLQDLLTRDIRVIDVGAVRIPSPQKARELAKPLPAYKPVFHTKPPAHIRELFAPQPDLPLLATASAAPATPQALRDQPVAVGS